MNVTERIDRRVMERYKATVDIVEITTKRQICHFLERYFTEVESFPLFWRLVLKQEIVILEDSCDLNNNKFQQVSGQIKLTGRI